MVELTTDIDSKVERGIKFWEEQAEKEQELNEKYSNTEKNNEIKMGQQQENQYNTNIVDTKESKKAIKVENKAAKRERIY